MKILFMNIPTNIKGLREEIISIENPSITLTAQLEEEIKALNCGVDKVVFQAPKYGDQNLWFWNRYQEPSDKGLFIQVIPTVVEDASVAKESFHSRCAKINKCINDFFVKRFPQLKKVGGVDVEILPPQWIGLGGKQFM